MCIALNISLLVPFNFFQNSYIDVSNHIQMSVKGIVWDIKGIYFQFGVQKGFFPNWNEKRFLKNIQLFVMYTIFY